MATRKKRSDKSKSRKSARGHRISTAGKIMLPLDVRKNSQLADFKKRITKGPLTIILVYADWCGHCHSMMPHFDAAAKSPNRSIQAVKVNEQMLPAVNSYVSRNINKSARPLNVEGYPSIIVVNNKGEKVTDLEAVRDTKVMTDIMDKTGDLAKNAGLTNSFAKNAVNLNVTESGNGNSLMKNTVKNTVENAENMAVDKVNIVAENIKNISSNIKPITNADIGEDELKESQAATEPLPARKRPNANANKNIIPLKNAKNSLEIANVNITAPSKNAQKEAEEIISLASPVAPPSISNDLTTEQKVGGSRGSGGSLMSAMSKTVYKLAAPAVLLSTAAVIMRHRRSKRTKSTVHKKRAHKTTHKRKTHRRRR